MNSVECFYGEKVNVALPICERRYLQRHRTQTIVSCSAFTSNVPETGIEGNVINFCEDGFYMETYFAYPVTTTLLIRVTHYSKRITSKSRHIGPKSLCLAQVMWRREVNDQHAVRYGMGLRYVK